MGISGRGFQKNPYFPGGLEKAQDGPKMAQDGPKIARNYFKMTPKWPQDAPGWPHLPPSFPCPFEGGVSLKQFVFKVNFKF